MTQIIYTTLFFSLLYSQKIDTSSYQEQYSFWESSKKTLALFSVGAFTFKENGFLNRKKIQQIRNQYIPNFRTHVDDFLQFTPIVLIYGLNFLGIKGVHSVENVTYRFGLSMLFSTIFVQGFKQASNVTRPDGSSTNSFPSGHTATAFVSASLLHREYKNTSPYYGVLAYALTSTTGILRVLNNRHWISDVFFGAGFGLISEEISNALFPQKNRRKRVYSLPHKKRNTFLNTIFSYIKLSSTKRKVSNSFSLGIDVGHFFHLNFGSKVQVKFTGIPIRSYTLTISPKSNILRGDIETEEIKFLSLLVGPIIRWNITPKIDIQINPFLGWIFFSSGKIYAQHNPFLTRTYQKKTIATYHLKQDTAFGISSSVHQNLSDITSLGLFVKYTWASTQIHYKRNYYLGNFHFNLNGNQKEIPLQHFSTGLLFSILF